MTFVYKIQMILVMVAPREMMHFYCHCQGCAPRNGIPFIFQNGIQNKIQMQEEISDQQVSDAVVIIKFNALSISTNTFHL